MSAPCTSWSDSLGLRERVRFRGFQEDMWAELARLDVLVHASTIPEPFGTVVLEGMAAGLTVLAPDQGGPATVIEDGRTGRLFRMGDQRRLASAMRELGRGPRRTRERLSGAARKAISAYHPDVIARRLEEVYEQALAAAGARRPPRRPRGSKPVPARSAGFKPVPAAADGPMWTLVTQDAPRRSRSCWCCRSPAPPAPTRPAACSPKPLRRRPEAAKCRHPARAKRRRRTGARSRSSPLSPSLHAGEAATLKRNAHLHRSRRRRRRRR